MDSHALFRAGSAAVLAVLLILTAQGALRAWVPGRSGDLASEVMAATVGGAEADVLVILEEQADLSMAQGAADREERLRRVYDALRTTALGSQAELRAMLEGRGVAYRPFHVVNMIALRGERDLLVELAARPEVDRVVANPTVRLRPPERVSADPGAQSAGDVEWNVERIGAPDVWALGYTGEGVVVAGQDTGYDWEHPALVERYRGYDGVTVTHDYHWHDAIRENDPHTAAGNPCGFDLAAPCDDNGQVTYTMGTMVGDDGASNQIGMAPNARWIGCRNMEQGWGTPATYAECFEFFVAPYPRGGDPFLDGEPTLAPHVINNSWTCPESEGCDWDTLQAVVENVRAAGILVVASAGNAGYGGCSTVQDPPAIYDAAFSVGATNSDDAAAGFSSRGPVTVDASGRLKPDLAAPGVGIRSSVPGGGYTWLSGTSMAGPHAAGAAALLWSAAPQLVGDVEATERTLARTARARTTTEGCGGDGTEDVPNNVYGWGIVDALAAAEAAVSGAQIDKQIGVPEGLAVRWIDYVLTVTNTAPYTLTEITLSDRIPVSTTLAWASGDYASEGDRVSWTVESLASWETLTGALRISLDELPAGWRVVNGDYGVAARELAGVVMGPPVETTIPWRVLLLPVFRDWQSERSGDG